MKIVTIIGARPQFIKAAVVSHVLKDEKKISEVVLHTGQHYDESLSNIFFQELNIPKPNYNLNIGSGSHGHQTGLMIQGIEKVLLKEKPNCVLVYGDTNSTLAGALAAVKLAVPIIHVEAGLRSFNSTQPEEINRILTDRIAELLIAPSNTAASNLIAEGIDQKQIIIVGDVMYDAVCYFAEVIQKNSQILQRLNIQPKQYLLATVHRAENTDELGKLKAIFDELNRIAKKIPVIFPLHPRTRAMLQENNLLESINNIALIDPIGYFDMQMLTKNAYCVVTDSGGLQKEAFYHKVPCIVLRDKTEWTELVELSWNILVSVQELSSINYLLENFVPQNRDWQNPYGEGRTAQSIVREITMRFS